MNNPVSPDIKLTAEDAEATEKTNGRQDNGISRMNRILKIPSPFTGSTRGVTGRVRGGWLPLVKGVGGILPFAFQNKPSPREGRGQGEGWVWITLIVVWAAVMPIAPPLWAADSTLPKTFTGSDPKGWRDFKWGITKQQAIQSGAEPYVDAAGEKHFGLPAVELHSGKTFQVRLKFFSHMGLNAVRVTLVPQPDCAQKVYETFLNDFRERYGKEKESRNLDYPNARYFSHDWIVGSTQIVLHHGCPKPGMHFRNYINLF